MRFLVDAQLPRAICPVLAHPDHEALHVKDILPLDVSDADIWRMALANEQVIVTKDEDFARRQQSRGTGPQIVWIRIGNCSNQALQAALQSVWPGVCAMLADGEKLVEVQ
jgi:predicted nuclease of predicted toxin-antitoxin system